MNNLDFLNEEHFLIKNKDFSQFAAQNIKQIINKFREEFKGNFTVKNYLILQYLIKDLTINEIDEYISDIYENISEQKNEKEWEENFLFCNGLLCLGKYFNKQIDQNDLTTNKVVNKELLHFKIDYAMDMVRSVNYEQPYDFDNNFDNDNVKRYQKDSLDLAYEILTAIFGDEFIITRKDTKEIR